MGLEDMKGEKLEILHKEIDLIQAVITRMAQNSFYMKGWCITLVAAVFSLSAKVGTVRDVAIPLAIMAAFFWVLDTNYLNLEKKYRGLYELVRKRRIDDDDYDDLYSLDYNLAEKPVKGRARSRIVLMWRWAVVLGSWSESCLYAPLILLLIGLNFGWWAWTSNWMCHRASESAGREVRKHENVPIGDNGVKRKDVNMPTQLNLVNGEMPQERPVIRAAEGRTAKSKE